MTPDDVRALADLARLKLSDEDVLAYQKDFEAILGYISTINSVPTEGFAEEVRSDTTNVMRSDDEAYEPGIFTEDLLSAAPAREGRLVKVRKVL
ncbi:aspartyl/glutamyl-tRNA amidotransferase subunit C [Patescibacteria group bacterium]|nr:aspartyl/glutamyl-tRNA amidotransferase subunit C [Patescibacteria group bacterium]